MQKLTILVLPSGFEKPGWYFKKSLPLCYVFVTITAIKRIMSSSVGLNWSKELTLFWSGRLTRQGDRRMSWHAIAENQPVLAVTAENHDALTCANRAEKFSYISFHDIALALKGVHITSWKP